MNQIKKVFAMVGNQTNEYLVLALQSGFSIFDFIFLPKIFWEDISFLPDDYQVKNTTLVYMWSEYKIKQSLYV